MGTKIGSKIKWTQLSKEDKGELFYEMSRRLKYLIRKGDEKAIDRFIKILIKECDSGLKWNMLWENPESQEDADHRSKRIITRISSQIIN